MPGRSNQHAVVLLAEDDPGDVMMVNAIRAAYQGCSQGKPETRHGLILG